MCLIRLLAVTVAGFFFSTSSYGQTKNEAHAWLVPSKWQVCQKSSDCISIYICGSVAINKNFEKQLKAKRKVSCAASPPPIENAICKGCVCQLNPPY